MLTDDNTIEETSGLGSLVSALEVVHTKRNLDSIGKEIITVL